MKLNRLFFLFILLICICLTSNVFAATHYVTLVGDTVRVRKLISPQNSFYLPADTRQHQMTTSAR
jgi:hypothetical protein